MSEEHLSPGCDAIRLDLNAYVDSELLPAEHAAVERHLEQCAACRAEADLLRLVTGSLRQVARPEPSEAMRQRLLAQVAAELPLRRIEIMCIERHGDAVIRRQEVRRSREPFVLPPLEPVSVPATGPVIQRLRQVLTDRPNCYQVIESHYGRDYHERRA